MTTIYICEKSSSVLFLLTVSLFIQAENFYLVVSLSGFLVPNKLPFLYQRHYAERQQEKLDIDTAVHKS